MIYVLTILFAFLAIVCSLCVITVRNPIHAILYLILVFCNISFVLIIWNAEFLAVIFLIVYVGAIAVLFLFVVMMLNIKIIELNEVFWRYVPVGFIISCIFLLELHIVLSGGSFLSDIYNNFIKNLTFNNYYSINFIEKFKFSSDINIFTRIVYGSSEKIFFLDFSNTMDKSIRFLHYTLMVDTPNFYLLDYEIYGGINKTITLSNIFGCVDTIQNNLFEDNYFFFNSGCLEKPVIFKWVLVTQNKTNLEITPYNWFQFNDTKTNIEILGWFVYTYSFYLFFIIGLILLLAMIGSIVLILNQNINVKRQFIFNQTSRNIRTSIKLNY